MMHGPKKPHQIGTKYAPVRMNQIVMVFVVWQWN